MSAKRNKSLVINEGESREIVIYRDANNAPKVEVLLQNENLWLTQKSLAQLFDVERSVITKHIKNIFTVNELAENSVCAKFAHTVTEQTALRDIKILVDNNILIKTGTNKDAKYEICNVGYVG